VSVQNNGTGCGASVFALQATVPAGWTAGLSASSLTLADGATGSTSLQVASSATATAGPFGLSLSTSESGLSGSAGATYTVMPIAAGGGGGGGSFTDGFDRADDPAALGNGWAAVSGGFQIVSGEARNQLSKVLHMAVRPELQGVAQTVSTTFASTSNNVSPRFGVVLHYVNAGSYYLCYRQIGGSSVLRIAKVVNGVETVLKSATVTNPAQGARFTLSCQANAGTLTLQLDGVTKATVADPASTVSGSVGFAMGGSAGGAISHRADDFSAIVQ